MFTIHGFDVDRKVVNLVNFFNKIVLAVFRKYEAKKRIFYAPLQYFILPRIFTYLLTYDGHIALVELEPLV